jgi:3-hydroxyisobutyrate dehydrogenase-like beta-hydroxyacid dehydrogenase
MKNKGFIGLGVMGFPMAGHISKAGYEVRVFNRSNNKAVSWTKKYSGEICSSPSEIGKTCDMVFLCVGNDADVEDVVLKKEGLIETMKKGGIIIDHTTTSAHLARKIFKETAKRQIHYLDAPLSGGEIGAKEGALTIMCGGDEQAFEEARKVMKLYSKFSIRMGESGTGQLTKMVNQICISGLIQSLAEGINFSENAGLDTKKVIEVISKGAAQSWQMDNRWETMLEDEYDHGFAVDWMIKDLGFIKKEASLNNSTIEITNLVLSFYEEIKDKGGGKFDTSSLLRRIQEK